MATLLVSLPLAYSPAASELGPLERETLVEDNELRDKTLFELLDYRVEVVYAASKHEQAISQAPSAVTVLTADEIKKFGYRNIGEALQSVRGVYLTYDRNYSYLGLRGFNRPGDFNSRVLVLVDGHRINENVFDSAYLGNDFPVDIDLIDRIEVIPGPSSSIYGNNAFFGVINVITRSADDFGRGEASASAGSFDTYKGRFSYGAHLTNGVSVTLSGSFLDSDGPSKLYYEEFSDINGGYTKHTDYESLYQFFGKVGWKSFSLEGGYSSREKGVPTAPYGSIFNDPDLKTVDDRGFVVLNFDHRFENELQLIAKLSYDHYEYNGDYPADDYPDDPYVLYEDYARGSWWGGDVQLVKKVWDRHTLTVGGEFQDHLKQDQGRRDNYEPEPDRYDDHRTSRNFGLYGQAEIAVVTNLLFNAGLRYDHYDTFGDTVNPRLGLIYDPWKQTTLKLLYGTAFKAPNAYELYYSGPNNLPNPDLNPETIETYEVVLEQDLTKNLQFVAAGYYYMIDDLITQRTFIDQVTYENMNRVSALGGEFELNARFANGWRGRASYTYQSTEDHETGDALENSPSHLLKFNLIVPLYRDKIFSGLEVRYRSRAGLNQLRAPGQYASEYWVANATLFSTQIIKNLEFSLSVYNLFDQSYYHPGSEEHLQRQIEQDGRTFRAKVTYRF